MTNSIEDCDRDEKLKIKHANLEINEEKSLKESYIFEVADILNEGSNASKFQTQLSVTRKKIVKLKSRRWRG